jgi:peptide/nickel transport system permease protein
MLTYVVRRIAYTIPVLIASTFLTFTFVSLSGNPTALLRSNPRVSPQTLHNIELQNHLDRSIPVRYWYWVESVFTQKLGKSLMTFQPIWPDIPRVLGHTAQVVILAELLALVLGIAVGIFSAIRQYSVFDYTFTTLSFVGLAMPTFWLALLLQILFVNIYLRWHVRIFYTSGLNSPHEGMWTIDRLQHIALPVITLTVISFALYSRYMRASMLDVINSDYVRTAHSKGLPETRVVLRHVCRNALIPVTTVAALNVGALLGGAIVTESVFSLDGAGFYLIQKLQTTDLYAVMGILLITSLILIVMNLVADILMAYLDPRIRLG